MSLTYLDSGWMRFGEGRKWRCIAPRYLCEVDSEGNTPNYLNIKRTLSRLRSVKSFYMGKLDFNQLDQCGTGLDIIVANSFAESFGTVPTPFSVDELQKVYNLATGNDPGVKLDAVVRYIETRQAYLVRREPNYINPIDTPYQISAVAHHVLLSTARQLCGYRTKESREVLTQQIKELLFRLLSESLYAANLAITYFNNSNAKHHNQPPLLAASYNAGSPRQDTSNPWNLKQYGAHIDRWVAYYNTSRMMSYANVNSEK